MKEIIDQALRVVVAIVVVMGLMVTAIKGCTIENQSLNHRAEVQAEAVKHVANKLCDAYTGGAK